MDHLFQINHPSLFLQASAAYQSEEEINAYLNFMVSVATSLGVERTQARTEMQRILDLEKELAHVGESFFSIHRLVLFLGDERRICKL